jgi:hypothetical protein
LELHGLGAIAEACTIVIPAKAGQIRLERIWTTEGWPEGQSPQMDFASQLFALSLDIHVFFRSPPGERATFVSAKVAKTMALDAMVSATSCCLDCPCSLPRARRCPRAAILGSLSRPHILVRALAGARLCRAKSRLALARALGCVAAASHTAPESSLKTAIPGPTIG